ncbi:MAG: PepSY domain-containing protein [Sphingobacteriales bacterium]|nr:PepSY domain-containing protein [Sphingobacteriales bacterium]
MSEGNKKKKKWFKPLMGQIHLWLGLASGIVVFILGLTGCIYLFEDQIKPIVYKERMEVAIPVNANKLPLSQLQQIAQQAVGKDKPLQGVEVPQEEGQTYAFSTLKTVKEPKPITYFGSIKYSYTVFVNPYTGKVVYIENSKYEFFRIIVMLHWSLLLNNDIGKPIVGIAVLMFVFLLITGVILWWPRNKKAIKKSFFVKWDASKKRLNYDLHNIFGFYAVIFGLMVSLTGLMWAFEWFNHSVQYIANGGAAYEKPKPIFSDTTNITAIFPLDKIYALAQEKSPEANSFFISIPVDKKSAVSVNARIGNYSHYKSRRSQYDQYSAKLLKTQTYADRKGGEKLWSLNYDLHVGSILGLPGMILAFFASFICASLPVTGFIIWWGKKKKTKTKQ